MPSMAINVQENEETLHEAAGVSPANVSQNLAETARSELMVQTPLLNATGSINM